jgi:hypothetical protein
MKLARLTVVHAMLLMPKLQKTNTEKENSPLMVKSLLKKISLSLQQVKPEKPLLEKPKELQYVSTTMQTTPNKLGNVFKISEHVTRALMVELELEKPDDHSLTLKHL